MDEVREVADAGGRLIVSPNFDAGVVAETKRLGLQSFPGIFTPTEAFAALKAGADGLKLFPASFAGPEGLKAMRAVLPHGTQVYAVGGAGAENFGDWIAAGADGFGIGTALFKPGLSGPRSPRAPVGSWRPMTRHEGRRRMSVATFDDRACILGEGPLWHPERGQLFWFDIMGKRLLTRTEGWRAGVGLRPPCQRGGWVDRETLLVASETDLFRFDLTPARGTRAPLEADNAATRSNDGRADPFGGFWIGTMGKNAEAGAGALYRYYRGEVVKLRDGITIPNATCFAPDGRHAYFADTAEHVVWRIALDGEGWPDGVWEVWLDHRESGINPDGAVVDAEGRFWCAEWGAARVASYDPDGKLVEEISLDVPQPTCPASVGMTCRPFLDDRAAGPADRRMDAAPRSGMTLSFAVSARGQAEHRVIL
jgi:sugar lactone lactonase YvrE